MLLRRRILQFKLAVLGWMILLVVLALQPDRLVETFLPLSIMRSIAHSIAYGSLAGFIWIYLKFRRRLWGVPMTGTRVFAAAFITASLWGGATEILQLFSADRYGEWNDFYFDMLGAALGIFAAMYLNRGSRPRSA